MIVERALIVSKVDEYRYTVRIPSMNKSAAAVGSTPDDELYTACVSTSPGIVPAYNKGDAVYISFEHAVCNTPMILGALLNENSRRIQSDIYATSLTVNTNVTLPRNTTIGKVTADNIATLEGQTIRVNSEFQRLDTTQQNIQSDIESINTTIVFMQEHDEEADANVLRLTNRVSTIESDTDAHYNNTTIHVTADEKTKWDGKADKVSNAKAGHLASLTKTGNLQDSGYKASDFAPLSHAHDDRYYTESEMDTKLGSKSDAAHTHTELTLDKATLQTIILKTQSYGSDLPSTPTTGQLFFLLESE